jgi:hypothetical protein
MEVEFKLSAQTHTIAFNLIDDADVNPVFPNNFHMFFDSFGRRSERQELPVAALSETSAARRGRSLPSAAEEQYRPISEKYRIAIPRGIQFNASGRRAASRPVDDQVRRRVRKAPQGSRRW